MRGHLSSITQSRVVKRVVPAIVGVLLASQLLVPGGAQAALPGLAWTTCPAPGCPESPEVEVDASNDTVKLGPQDPEMQDENDIQNSSRHAAAALLPAAGRYEITFKYNLSSWDSYNSPGTPNPPFNGGTGYWDSFSLSVAPRPYWELDLSDPITSSNLPGLGFIWGATSYGDGSLETTGATVTVVVPGDKTADNYLNVALDTATLPNANHAFPSFGLFTILDIKTSDPAVNPSLTVDQRRVKASPGGVLVSDIPLQPNSPNAESAPIRDIEIIGSPIRDIEIIGSPIRDIEIIGSPIRDIEIIGSPIRDIEIIGSPLTFAALKTVTLADTPLVTGSWEKDVFPGTSLQGVPSQNVTWAQLLTLNPQPPALAAISFGDIDWGDSALGEISPAAIYLGRVSARDITLPTPAELPAVQRWCTRWQAQGFADCGQKFGGLDATLFAQQLAGVDLRTFPVGSVPLGNIKAGKALFLDLLLLGDVNDAGINSTVGLGATPFGSVSYASIPPANQGLVFDCTKIGCGANPTLAEGASAGALRSGATVRHLGTTQSDGSWTLGVPPADDFSLSAVPMGEILYSLVPAEDNPIEDIPLAGLVHYEGRPGFPVSVLNYTYTFMNSGLEAINGATALATLPASFVYVGGSAKNATTGEPLEPSVESSASGVTLSWTANVPPGSSLKINFQMRPGLEIGTFGSHAAFMIPGGESHESPGPSVSVVERFEPNGTAPTESSAGNPTPIQDGVAYFSHNPESSDIDYFEFPAGSLTPGTKLNFSVSHLSHDGDLFVYAPEGAAGTSGLGSSPIRDIEIIGSPIRDIEIIGSPVSEPNESLNDPATSSMPELEQDMPILKDRSLAGFSINRGLANEFVEIVVPDGLSEGDSYLVQASGYMQAASASSYLLRVKTTPAPVQPPCGPRAGFTYAAAGGTPPVVTTATKTIFLTNPGRMNTVFGPAGAGMVNAEVTDTTFLARSEIQGSVVPVDQSTDIQAAYEAWDASPCSESAANGVVEAINTYVRSLLPEGSLALENIVLVGTDLILPHSRLVDLSKKFNQRTYAGALAFTTKDLTENNSQYSATVDGFMFGDNPYADFNSIDYGGQQLFVPDLGLGRLGEGALQIVDQFNRYEQFDGALDPAAVGLTTSYDFQEDMGAQIAAIIGGKALNNETWTAANLKSEFLTKPNNPDIISPNGHTNHYQLLGGAGNTNFDLSDILSTSDVLAGNALTRAAIFSMGCNKAMSIEDVVVGSPMPESLDWAQAYGEKGAAVFGGNMGTGYGHKFLTLYSERQMVLYAENLKKGHPSGLAMTFAKQQAFGEVVPTEWDEYLRKTTEVLTHWGLPHWHLGAATPPALTTVTLVTDPATGLPSHSLSVSPVLTQTNTAEGSYFQDGTTTPSGGASQPIMAKTLREITASSGEEARGFFITGGSQTTVGGFDPVITSPIYDDGDLQPEPQLAGLNSTSLGTIGTSLGAGGSRQTLNLLTTAFSFTGFSRGKTIGTLTKRDTLDAKVFYADASNIDRLPPRFVRVEGFISGDGPFTATFDVELRDETPSDFTDIRAVEIVLIDGGMIAIVALDQIPGTDRWIGKAETASASLQYSAQAVDSSSNTSRTRNKQTGFGDNSPPVIDITTPFPGEIFGINQIVPTSFSCSDDSGVAPTCEGPDLVDTAIAGRHNFQVTSVDGAGNVAFADVVYYVDFSSFAGFFSPVRDTDNPNGQLNSVKEGQAVPLKWQLKDFTGSFYRSLTVNDVSLQWKAIACSGTRSEAILLDDPGLLSIVGMQYDPVGEQYVLVVKTPALGWGGQCRRALITLAGIETHFADFKFK